MARAHKLGKCNLQPLKNLQILINTKLQEKSCCYLHIYVKNASLKVKTDEILAARAICNLHMSYNFEPVLHEYALVFGQSRARNFFSCIPLNSGYKPPRL